VRRFVVALALLARSAGAESGHERMLDLLREVAARTPEHHLYLSDAKARALRAAFEALPSDAPDVLKWEAHLKLGEEEQRVGRELEAIRHFEAALNLLPRIEADVAEEWVVRLYFRLGMAYLRHGETTNCALQHTPESCILPIRGSGIHVDRDPSRRAIGYFLEALARAPKGSDPYLTSLWLLNVAFMTVDAYPAEVPPEYLIPPERFTSDVEFPRFANVAARAGVDTFSLSGGVVVEDFDDDGYLDLLVSGYEPTEQLRLWISDEDGTFTDRTAAAGLLGLTGGLNMVQGDYDDDGDMDVYVLRGAWLEEAGRHPNSLLRNNGDGTFTDVTFETGLGEHHYPTQTASWADYDNDSDLDLYVGNETNGGLSASCQLFENQDDGTFVDVASDAGVTNDRFTKAVMWGDYDGDGWPDLYVSNLYDDNRLYRNLHDGRFEDVAPKLGVTGPRASFPAWFWDFDNDGVLDIYVSAYEAIVKHLAAFYLGHGYSGELQRLYRGDGKGGFSDVASARGLDQPNAPMGSNFGDLDGDGYLDFYLGTGYPPYYAIMPNVMYWNRRGERFDDVTMAGGFGHLQKGHAVAFVDFDADGDQDVFEEMGGALAGDKFTDVLYENPGFGNHRIELELVGVQSNRAAMGARIHVRVEEGGSLRDVYKDVNSGGTFGASSVRRQFVGLGRADRIEEIEIFWPTTGRRQVLHEVPRDERILVVETWGDDYRILH
jgi:tetratricopeptide (TPR) repeat protein